MTADERAVRTAARRYLLAEHGDTLAAVVAAADAVSDGWTGPATTDRAAVVDPLRRRLELTGHWQQFPGLLRGAAEAAGLGLVAEPVAAPPYLVMASTGPVFRGTALAGRLVISVRVFEVDREGSVRYRRGASDVDSTLAVRFHPTQ